jgi:hypothetical protein
MLISAAILLATILLPLSSGARAIMFVVVIGFIVLLGIGSGMLEVSRMFN